MANDVTAPILSYEEINRRADEFLKEHERGSTLPVDIEAIAEFDLGLDIFPFPGLQETFDLEGFISGNLTMIYVDEFIYYQRPTRYRFTVAHEVGHYVIHSNLMAAIHPQSASEWKRFTLGIDEETYGWLEYQAYTFAAAVLMPRWRCKDTSFMKSNCCNQKLLMSEPRGFLPRDHRTTS